MDNIDHNPTTKTASTSFHDTSISIFQHPNADNKGEMCEPFKNQKKPPSYNIPSVLPTRQDVYGVSQLYANLNLRVLQIGDGYNKLEFGRPAGVLFNLLLQVAKN